MRLRVKELGRAVMGAIVAVAVLAAAVTVKSSAWAQTETAAPQEQNLSLGVVDFSSLIKEHSDYQALSQLDEQIRLLEEELQFLPMEDQRRVVDSSQQKMRAEVTKAQQEVKREYDKINAEMTGLQAKMSGELQAEAQKLQAHYKQVLDERLKALGAKGSEPPYDAKRQLDSYLRDVSQVREQRLVAKRLELERQMASTLENERNRSDAALADYDNEVMMANQERRVNLQLRLQTITDPEEEAKIQDELSKLGEEEAQKKQERADELRKEFEKLARAEQAKVNSELAAYEKRLNDEARANFDNKRDKVLGGIQPVNVAENRELAKEQIDKVRNIVDAEMKAKQQEMQAAMKKRAEEANAILAKKQAEVEKRLRALQAQLNDLVKKTYENVSPETRKKMDDVQAKLDELKKQRQNMYDAMIASLSQVVGQVAEKQNVQTVIGSYIVNVNCVDLTDLAMVALKQQAHQGFGAGRNNE